ncbi:hypothetical protein BK133_22840 [Paenibacillus sp. FSL H8-0548]|nr:hypothetical protein BK133_22840 [Paenibacillus sp. FSL H8-0548]
MPNDWKVRPANQLQHPQQVQCLYQFLGHQKCYMSLLGNDAHDFPEHIRAVSYPFLDRWLKEETNI